MFATRRLHDAALPCARFILGIVIVALMFTLAPTLTESAGAYRWTNSTVTYRNHTPWGGSVERAVSWWNRTPGHLRLVRAGRGRRANINIVKANLPADVAGYGTYPPGGGIRLDTGWMRRTDDLQRAEIVAHEIGHALGLDHLSLQCSIMHGGPGGPSSNDCDSGLPDGVTRCGPQRSDARMLTRLYGGHVGDFRGFRCGTVTATPPSNEPQQPQRPVNIGGQGGTSNLGNAQPPTTVISAPLERRRLQIAVDVPDEHTFVFLNGRVFREIRDRQPTVIDFGELLETDVVLIGTYNEDGWYQWKYRIILDGQEAYTDSGQGPGREHSHVRRFHLDGWGSFVPSDLLI